MLTCPSVFLSFKEVNGNICLSCKLVALVWSFINVNKYVWVELCRLGFGLSQSISMKIAFENSKKSCFLKFDSAVER